MPSAPPTIHARAWYALALLMLAYTSSFVDRMILTLMVDPIRRDLDLTDTQFSLLHGLAFALFYTLLGLPFGRLADRADRRRLIAGAIAAWSTMTALCGLSRTYVQLFLARVGVGIGEGALSPAAYSMLSDLFPRDRLARALSIYSMGIAAGGGLALLVGGHVVSFAESTGAVELPGIGLLQPWQLVFMLVGLPGLPLALLIWHLREPSRTGVLQPRARLDDVRRFVRPRLKMFNYLYLGLSVATALGHSVMGWVPAYFMRVHGWSAGQVGSRYGLCMLLAGIAGLALGALLTERWQRRGLADAPLRAAALGIGLCTLFGVLAPQPGGEISALLLYSGFLLTYMMPWGIAPAAIALIAPNEMRGLLSAFYLLSINLIGLGAGPTYVALLSDHVFGSQGVGQSLAVASVTLGPLATLLLVLGCSGYREAVASSRQWAP
jgi:MFS family permease